MTIDSRRKGHDFERLVASRLGEVFGRENVRRGLQYRDGADAPDVVAPGLWVECKRARRTNPRAALAQAEAAAEGKGLWVVAVCKDDHQEPFVALGLEDFVDILRELWALKQR